MHYTQLFNDAGMIILVGACSCCEDDIDYHGNDINMNPNDKDYQATDGTGLSCQKRCQARPKCHFFTWNTENKRCYLKTSTSGRMQHDHGFSGPKHCGNRSSVEVLR